MRGAIVQAGYFFQHGQEFVQTEFCEPCWSEFVRDAHKRELIAELPGYEAYPEAYGARWTRPGREAIDNLKEAQGDVMRIKNKLASVSGVLARYGVDLEEHLDELVEEIQEFGARGIPMPSDTHDDASLTKENDAGADDGEIEEEDSEELEEAAA
jgi:capsid protein